jgi:hypothetical protein
MSTPTTLRNSDLASIAEVLKSQADARFDVVAHSSKLHFQDGNLMVEGAEAIITDEGVTPLEVCLEPTPIMDEGLAARLDIPRGYVRKMREAQDCTHLLDANLNEWLSRSDRQWFVRGFKGQGEECGIGRAFLSDRFGCIDNYDVLLAALAGIRKAGVEVNVVGCDLSDRRMTVKVEAPAIAALAPDLLRNYRSPFDNGERRAENAPGWNLERGREAARREGLGFDEGREPLVFAGFIISNSETGGGAFTITPRLVVQVCKNGLTISKDALRKVHLGSQMDEGLIVWSDDTRQKNVELVTAQAADAVSSFCNVEYVRSKITEIEAAAGVAITEPTKVIERVSKALTFSKEEADGILGHFITGGQMTAGGVLNAVTSYAQTIADPDRANEIEEAGLPALALAASV